jgi:hypothetical protein
LNAGFSFIRSLLTGRSDAAFFFACRLGKVLCQGAKKPPLDA